MRVLVDAGADLPACFGVAFLAGLRVCLVARRAFAAGVAIVVELAAGFLPAGLRAPSFLVATFFFAAVDRFCAAGLSTPAREILLLGLDEGVLGEAAEIEAGNIFTRERTL